MVTMATQNTNGSSQERPADIAEQMMGVGHRTTEPLGCGTLRLEGGVAWRADDASFPIFFKKKHITTTWAEQWFSAPVVGCQRALLRAVVHLRGTWTGGAVWSTELQCQQAQQRCNLAPLPTRWTLLFIPPFFPFILFDWGLPSTQRLTSRS